LRELLVVFCWVSGKKEVQGSTKMLRRERTARPGCERNRLHPREAGIEGGSDKGQTRTIRIYDIGLGVEKKRTHMPEGEKGNKKESPFRLSGAFRRRHEGWEPNVKRTGINFLGRHQKERIGQRPGFRKIKDF